VLVTVDVQREIKPETALKEFIIWERGLDT
jgi:hypothetical protein